LRAWWHFTSACLSVSSLIIYVSTVLSPLTHCAKPLTARTHTLTHARTHAAPCLPGPEQSGAMLCLRLCMYACVRVCRTTHAALSSLSDLILTLLITCLLAYMPCRTPRLGSGGPALHLHLHPHRLPHLTPTQAVGHLRIPTSTTTSTLTLSTRSTQRLASPRPACCRAV
jgi:hypothetical protein